LRGLAPRLAHGRSKMGAERGDMQAGKPRGGVKTWSQIIRKRRRQK